MEFINKHKLTLKENIFLAKNQLVGTIYKQARMENINITFPQTKVIFEQGVVNNINVSDIEKIVNLKRAWYRLLDTIGEPLSLEYIQKIHYDISLGEALVSGELRNGTVTVTGTNFVPDIPTRQDFLDFLDRIQNIENPIDRALEYIAVGIRNQYFWECNKRTSFLIGNKILIENGCGIVAVPENDLVEYNEKLTELFDNNNKEDFKCFLYNKAMVSIAFKERREMAGYDIGED